MSEAAIISLITVIGGLLSLIIKELFAMHKAVKVVDKKVDDYHKEVNGHMTNLLQLTKEKAKEQGKAEEKQEQAK